MFSVDGMYFVWSVCYFVQCVGVLTRLCVKYGLCAFVCSGCFVCNVHSFECVCLLCKVCAFSVKFVHYFAVCFLCVVCRLCVLCRVL